MLPLLHISLLAQILQERPPVGEVGFELKLNYISPPRWYSILCYQEDVLLGRAVNAVAYLLARCRASGRWRYEYVYVLHRPQSDFGPYWERLWQLENRTLSCGLR